MKKIFHLLLVAALIVALSACGNNGDLQAKQAASTSGIAQNTGDSNEPQPSDPNTPTSGETDVDLTKLSSTMVYSEVYNMMTNPDEYVGKTVKMQGMFGIGYSCKDDGSVDENTIVFACVIADATACCSQGIEFVLTGEHSYPADYPELGSEITVTGTFELYTENGFQYCRLANAVLSS